MRPFSAGVRSIPKSFGSDASASSFADLFHQLAQPRAAGDMPAKLNRPPLDNVHESVVAGITMDRSSEPLDDLTAGWANALSFHIRGGLALEAVVKAVEPDLQTQGEAAAVIEARLKEVGL